jgi:flagellum-specific ATP synthase
LASRIATKDERESARRIREALSLLDRSQDLINLGAYASGANSKLDIAIRFRGEIDKFLRQEAGMNAPIDQSLKELRELASGIGV